MNTEEIAIEESKVEPQSRTASNLEGLMKFNIFLSTITLVSVAGATALDYAMIAWLWV
jgi:hypothetical protein